MSAIETLFDCIFFVGGRGTKAGNAAAGGGCTRLAWKGSLNQDLSKVMDENGGPLSDDSTWGGGTTYPCAVSQYTGGWVKITKTGGFANCNADLAAYVEFEATYSTDRYRVREVIDNDSIVIDLAWSADANCRINIGGAFAQAQGAWNNTSPGSGNGTTIYSNKSQSYSGGDFTSTWNLGTLGGSLASKSFKRFCGFTTQPGDGGQVTFDGADDAVFSPDGGIRFNSSIENVIFENVIVEGAYNNWKVVSVNVNSIRFTNCGGNSGAGIGWLLSYGRNFILIDCQANYNSWQGFNLGYSSGGPNHLLLNCTAHDNTREGFGSVGGCNGSVLLGCIAYNNGNGTTKYSGFSTNSYYGCGMLKNCVAYNNGKHGFEFKRANPVAINCIAKDNGQWGFYANTSNPLMAPHVAYCCAHGNSSGQFSLPAALPQMNCIGQDPLFKNAGDGDFRPRNPAVLRGGKPDISGNPTQTGAILQKYQFGDRERIANMARLRIIR